MRIIPACISGRYHSLTHRIIPFAASGRHLTGSCSGPSLCTPSHGLDPSLLLLFAPPPRHLIRHLLPPAAARPSLTSAIMTSSSGQSKAHNIATFAGAVGGSVGLLAVLALSLAISIYRRRMRARRRDRRYRRSQNRSNPDFDGESFHTDGSDDGPPMQGPAPFVPRYFPGTVVPAPPPPYSPPADQTTALLSSMSPPWGTSGLPGPSEDTSYADRPPPSPPPIPEEGVDDYFAPPSFPQAISSPIPAIVAGYSPVAPGPTSTSPVPRHTNGSSSRGVYATGPRPRSDSDAQSQRSDYSDRPPSFASQDPAFAHLRSPEGGTDASSSPSARASTHSHVGESEGGRTSPMLPTSTAATTVDAASFSGTRPPSVRSQHSTLSR